MWRITRDCQLSWRKWDEEYVVYNSGSGDTHLLDSFGAEILLCLKENPSDAHELAMGVLGDLETDQAPMVTSRIEQLLAQFEAVGLVEFI
jgi:PqqD family protein of HPr-rel-A system